MSVVIRMVFGGRHASAGAKRRTTLDNKLMKSTNIENLAVLHRYAGGVRLAQTVRPESANLVTIPRGHVHIAEKSSYSG